MLFISATVNGIKTILTPPADMDNAAFADLLKYNFMLLREYLKSHFPNRKFNYLQHQIRTYLPGNEHNPPGDFIVDTELESPQDVILMDERGRLRRISKLDGQIESGKVPAGSMTPVSIDNSTLIYFGGIGSRAVPDRIAETDSHILNRIGSTANTLEKVLLPAYETLFGTSDEPVPPKKDRLRSLGVTATYVYAYHGHRLDLEPFGDDDIRLKTLIWDYELMRLRQNPKEYFGKEEQFFVENVFLPRIARDIDMQDGKFVRNTETGRIRIFGALEIEKLLLNCRFTLVGYSLGADVIHRMRNCLVAYLRDLYPETVVARALQQVVAITSCGANPCLKDEPNFTTVRCIDIHDIGTLCRNPQFDLFPWGDMRTGTYRAVYMNRNETICWMRAPYRVNDRINDGYHDEKFCLGADYFPEVARDVIIKSASYHGILPKKAMDYLTTLPAVLKQSADQTELSFAWAKRVVSPKQMAFAMLIATALAAIIDSLEFIPA